MGSANSPIIDYVKGLDNLCIAIAPSAAQSAIAPSTAQSAIAPSTAQSAIAPSAAQSAIAQLKDYSVIYNNIPWHQYKISNLKLFNTDKLTFESFSKITSIGLIGNK